MEQIGNSVPPLISLMFADIINNHLLKYELKFSYVYEDQSQLDLFKEAI